jgi:hypothetical protein
LEIGKEILARRSVRGFHIQIAHIVIHGAGVFVSPEYIPEHGSIAGWIYTLVFHEPLNQLMATAQKAPRSLVQDTRLRRQDREGGSALQGR